MTAISMPYACGDCVAALGDDGHNAAHGPFHTILMLFAAGVVGGMMASLVGGASVVTFPVLLALGLPPVVATASNLVAVSAGNFLAALTDRAQLPPFNRAFVGLVLASVLGALLGAVLLLATPERAVRVPDPAAARLRHRAVRLCRPHHAMAARARAARGGREWQIERDQHPAGAAGLGLRRLFRRRRRRAAARRADRSRPAATIAAPTWRRIWCRASTRFAASVVLHRQRRGELAADAGDDGGLPGRRLLRRASGARVVPQAVMRVVVVGGRRALTAVFAWRYWF